MLASQLLSDTGTGRTSGSGSKTAYEAAYKVPQRLREDPTPPTQPFYYGGGGGGVQTIQYEQPDYSAWFNALTNINNQKYEALKDAIANQKQRADNLTNMGYARNLREWRKMYADSRNGQGLSNRMNIAYNRDSQLENNRETYDTNNLSAISGRYSDLAGLTGQLANMNNDTIKKIMSNVSSWKM